MKKKTIIILVILGVIFLTVSFFVGYKIYQLKLEKEKKAEEEKIKQAEEKLINEITNQYNEFVMTNKESKLYILENDKYKEIGTVSPNTIFNLDKFLITKDTKYFKVLGLDQDYYIKYQDVDKTEAKEKDKRYLNYIKFNKTIVTKEKTNFYIDNTVIYSINHSFKFPVYIIDENKYYIEYDGRLMYIMKDDIEQIINENNSDTTKAKQISTIAYHFIYDSDKGEQCNEIICHTFKQVQSHIDYLKNNNYFTPTMKEFEMWIDGKLNLPKKSIMITVDDGAKAENAAKIFTDNKINATVFVVSAWFDPKIFETEYFEIHSHGHNLHNSNACPGYGEQGGAIQCLSKNELLNDLKTSRERTNMTTVFAYPFYEFNNYSIEVLKEAGFTMAFGGTYAGGRFNMTVGANKFKIPRITMLNTSTVNDLVNVLNTN